MMPKRFYFKLFAFWAFWVSLYSILYALILSFISALATYFSKGFAPLNERTLDALKEIFFFSFPIGFSLSFIIVLLLVFKALFAYRIDGHRMILHDCEHQRIDKPLLSDVTPLWRKWLFVTVWMILLFIVLFLGLFKLIFGTFPPLQWFNGFSLYILVLSIGGPVFVYGVKSCKKIGIINA